MLIIDNCFQCPDSRFDVLSKEWVCPKHNNKIIKLYDDNKILPIPTFCKRPDFLDISLMEQERRLLLSEIIETLSEETIEVIKLILNSPSDIINSITSVIVGKSNNSKKRISKKYICHYCKKEIRDGEKSFSGKPKNSDVKSTSIIFCSDCKEKYNLTEDDFKTNLTEQTLIIGIRKKFGWKYKMIDRIVKELRIFPNLI